MCLQTKSYHLSKELDCTTLCNSFIVMLKIYIYVILICLLLFSALIGSGELCFLVWFYLASKFTCILCLMHLLVCLGSYQMTLYLAFLYVSLYLIMYFQQFRWFLIKLLLVACIFRYSLLLDVPIDICFVFTMYLINLTDTNRRYSGYCFLIK